MTKKKNNRRKKPTLENVTNTILGILRKNSGKPFNYKQVAAKMGVDDPTNRNKIIRTLAQLAAKKQIEEVEKGKYQLSSTADYYTGFLDMTTKGGGYVVVEDFEDDVFIPS